MTSAVTDENLKLLSERGRKAIQTLMEFDQDGSQTHVYGGWPEAGTEDDGKKRLADQVSVIYACSWIIIRKVDHGGY